MSLNIVLFGILISSISAIQTGCRRVHLEQDGSWNQNPDEPQDTSRTNPMESIRKKTDELLNTGPDSPGQEQNPESTDLNNPPTQNILTQNQDPQENSIEPHESENHDPASPGSEETGDNSENVDDLNQGELSHQQRCESGQTHIFVSENTYNHTDALNFCQSQGADVFAHHIRKYSYLHETLADQLKGILWIHSWNTDDYGQSCLYLHEGVAVTEGVCTDKQKVLCECHGKNPDSY